jgi:hypothetical protein
LAIKPRNAGDGAALIVVGYFFSAAVQFVKTAIGFVRMRRALC